MMTFLRKNAISLAIVGSLALAAGSGFLASQALGGSLVGSAKTVTINVGTGATGPAGPQGPAGPAGPAGPKGEPGAPGDVASCPNGFSAGEVVVNHPGGQTILWTCLKD
jgi:hypothetical protein